ncbi:MAG: lipocalin family protein [Chitinophagales bacterium]|jgi:hypothetical protein|nr:lipocalin family protein [Chitinophagales bacterium]
MKKITLIVAVLILVASCNQKKSLTDNLAGKWNVYKLIKDNIDKTNIAPYSDSINDNYTIEFTAGGTFTETYYPPVVTDTTQIPGNWVFENNNETLTLTDTIYKKRSFTIFNLEGNHVELRRGGQNRYLRKQ